MLNTNLKTSMKKWYIHVLKGSLTQRFFDDGGQGNGRIQSCIICRNDEIVVAEWHGIFEEHPKTGIYECEKYAGKYYEIIKKNKYTKWARWQRRKL